MPSFEEVIAGVHKSLIASGSRNVSGNNWLCPIHEKGRGHSASLTVKKGDAPGQIVMKCAKCDTSEVLDAIGLTYDDLAYYAEPLRKTGRIVHNYPDARGQKYLRVVRTRFSDGSKKSRRVTGLTQAGQRASEGASASSMTSLVS